MTEGASNRPRGGLRAAPARMARRLFAVLRCKRATLAEIAGDPRAQYEALLLTALVALFSAGLYDRAGDATPDPCEWLAIAGLRCLGLLPTALAMWAAGRLLQSRAPFAAWFGSFAYAGLPGVAVFPLYLGSFDALSLVNSSVLFQNSVHAAMLIAYPFSLVGNPGRLLRLPLHEWVYFGVFCWQALLFLHATRSVLQSTLPVAALCLATAGALCTALAFLVAKAVSS